MVSHSRAIQSFAQPFQKFTIILLVLERDCISEYFLYVIVALLQNSTFFVCGSRVPTYPEPVLFSSAFLFLLLLLQSSFFRELHVIRLFRQLEVYHHWILLLEKQVLDDNWVVSFFAEIFRGKLFFEGHVLVKLNFLRIGNFLNSILKKTEIFEFLEMTRCEIELSDNWSVVFFLLFCFNFFLLFLLFVFFAVLFGLFCLCLLLFLGSLFFQLRGFFRSFCWLLSRLLLCGLFFTLFHFV